MSDLKETKEFIVGAIALAKVISMELKDGYQARDLVTIASKIAGDSGFRAHVWNALQGIQNIPQELKETPTIEIITEIGTVTLDALKA